MVFGVGDGGYIPMKSPDKLRVEIDMVMVDGSGLKSEKYAMGTGVDSGMVTICKRCW